MPQTLSVSDIRARYPVTPIASTKFTPTKFAAYWFVVSPFRKYFDTWHWHFDKPQKVHLIYLWKCFWHVFNKVPLLPNPPSPLPPCSCCSGIAQHFQRLRLTIRVRNLIKSACDRHFLAWQISKFKMSNEISSIRASFAGRLGQLVWLLEIYKCLTEILKWSIYLADSADKQLMSAHQSGTENLKKSKQTIPKWPGQANQYK